MTDNMSAAEIYTEPWIYWLEAAGIHLEATRACREVSTSGIPIGPRKIEATLAELPAAMQTIAAAAFAVDGFDGAVGDVVTLPKERPPRARAIRRRLTSVLELDDPAGHERDLLWLFEIRNCAVHAGVWKDSRWLHPSGLTVSRTQEETSAYPSAFCRSAGTPSTGTDSRASVWPSCARSPT